LLPPGQQPVGWINFMLVSLIRKTEGGNSDIVNRPPGLILEEEKMIIVI
jgi:hypothetical protein